MNGQAAFNSPMSSSSSSTESVQADAAIADYSHTLGGRLAIIPSADTRDAPGLDGHRATDLPLETAAA